MSFVHAQLFWILIVPLIAFGFFILRHQDNFLEIFDTEVLKRLSIGDDSMSVTARNTILLLALFFLLLALARPAINQGEHTLEQEGFSALLALDISASMRSKDIYPNRLEFAKKNISYLFDILPNTELGLIAFSHSVFMLAPFSSDKVILEQLLDGVEDQYISMNSTNFKSLAHFSAKVLKKKEPKILILFTDGGEAKDTIEFAKVIKKEKITLYVVLLGTEQGSPVLDKQGNAVSQNGKIIISKRDDTLGKIATKSGGAYILASGGRSSIKKLLEKIQKKHQYYKKGRVTIYDREELFYYPLGFGLLLLLIGFGSLPRKKYKEK
jgi:Ca-activated chloride channel family protein